MLIHEVLQLLLVPFFGLLDAAEVEPAAAGEFRAGEPMGEKRVLVMHP